MAWQTHEWLYLVKNLHCLLFLPPETEWEQVEKLVSWIARHYRYRIVGVKKTVLENLPEGKLKERLGKPPFQALDFEEVLPAKLRDVREVPSLLIHAWVANLLSTPVVTLRTLVPLIRESGLVVWECHSREEPDDRDRKFNVRLGDYAMTDFLKTLVPDSLVAGQEADAETGWQRWLQRRQSAAGQDGKTRYWRLLESGGEGASPQYFSVCYLDPWRVLLANAGGGEERTALLKEIAANSSQLLNLTVLIAF